LDQLKGPDNRAQGKFRNFALKKEEKREGRGGRKKKRDLSGGFSTEGMMLKGNPGKGPRASEGFM